MIQHAEGLTNHQAADADRGGSDRKYALSLEPTDLGLYYSVLGGL